MFSYLFDTFFYNPIYNGLIFLVSSFPWIDLGIAVIIVTVIVKLILFPLTKRSIKTQIKMKEVEPLIAEAKEKYKKDKETQAKRIMEIYKENEINPFSNFFLILVQLPDIVRPLLCFYKRGFYPKVDP